MGLPEIADFARNFSIMVRIQGPDPKGLKMRKHAFHHYSSGKTTVSASGMLLPGSLCSDQAAREVHSESDMQLFPGFGLALTVASVIEPFLSQHQRGSTAQAKPVLIPGVQIDIMMEGKMGVEYKDKVMDKEAPQWQRAQLLKLLDIPSSAASVQTLIEASSSSAEHDWEVGWSLASYRNGPQSVDTMPKQVGQPSIQSQMQMAGLESSNPSFIGKSTTRIALLGVSSIHFEGLPNLNTSPLNKRGHLLLAMGSPFGILSPVHFFNSMAVGSIANCYPPNSSTRSLLMADIRCLPGMEGSPGFGENAQLIGILTKPLRQRTSGAELQLVIPWEAIASACSDLLLEKPQKAWEGIHYNNGNLNAAGKERLFSGLNLDESLNHSSDLPNSDCFPLTPLEKAMASICLVTTYDGAWASGILLNNHGLILTNAHFVEPWRFRKATANNEANKIKCDAVFTPLFEYTHLGNEKLVRNQHLLPKGPNTVDFPERNNHVEYKFDLTDKSHRKVRVRLDYADPWIWCDAKVIYVSKGSLDVALLQLEFVPHQLRPIVMDFTCPSPGSMAYVIGHGLFGPRCEAFPSACVGVVAKVVEAKRTLPYRSTKQVNGQCFPAMIETTAAVHPGGSGGAVVNSYGQMIGLVTSNARHGGGTLIPHLNFSIPCAALEPIFKFSRDMQEISLLEDLDKPDEHLSALWALMPSLSPKPSLPLPNLPPILQGDDSKDVKGSRFAKFIADRHELLKTQLRKEERLPSKLVPSKL